VSVGGERNSPILSGNCLFALDADTDHYLIADSDKKSIWWQPTPRD
jgi:hypothetical protein